MTPTVDPEKAAITELVNLSVTLGTIKGSPDLNNLFSLDILNRLLKERGLKWVY